MKLLTAAKRLSTQTAYASALKVFDLFWARAGIGGSPFPLSHATELRFVTWLSVEHPVRSSTAAQYLSAVRSHSMLSSSPVSAEHVSLAVKGMANLEAVCEPKPVKQTWLASYVMGAASKLLVLLAAPSPPLVECQALVASIVGFLFLSRASTVCAIRPVDFSVVGATLLFCERYRKSKQVPSPRTLQLRLDSSSPAWSVVEYCSFLRKHHPDLIEQSIISFFPQAYPAARVDACLGVACRLLGDDGPGLHPWSSHALRRGGAVSMLAVGVPLIKICEWGHWSGESSIRPYIVDRAFQCPSPADLVCFEWLVGTNRSIFD